MIVYVDIKHHVYASPRDDCAAVETNIFEGMPPAVIECYKHYPADDAHEEFAQAWKSSDEIACRQVLSDNNDLATQNEELVGTIATMVEDLYQQDLEIIEGE